MAKRTGAGFRMIHVNDDGELDLGELEAIASEGNVKVVATNLVSNALGTINPVEKLAAWAHAQGAIVVVDAAQAAPHHPVDVQALGCDFVAFSAHKMCGPTGVGALWGRRELLEAMEPFNLGGHMIRKVRFEETTWGELPHKFEAGTSPIAEAVGFGAAIDYLNEIGLDGDRARTSTSSPRTRSSGWRRSRASTLYGPPADRRAGIVSFNVDEIHPHDVAQILDSEGIAIRAGHHCCQPLMTRFGVAATNRASFYLYTIPEEIDRLVDGLHKVQKILGLGARGPDLYREVILDHYKNPRGHGVIEDADASAEGMNPLCGDEVSIYVAFADDGETIDDVMFSGRGCAISQASTSMLMEMVKGKTATEVAGLPEGGAARGDRHPADAGPAQVRAARAGRAQGRAAPGEGDAAPRGVGGPRRAGAEVGVAWIDVCPVDELPPGR